MVAVKIVMKSNALASNNPKDIEKIGISDGDVCKCYAVTDLYSYLIDNPSVKIGVYDSNSYLVPVRAMNGQIYLRSEPNEGLIDPLLSLPRVV